jgi:hypothetical protein
MLKNLEDLIVKILVIKLKAEDMVLAEAMATVVTVSSNSWMGAMEVRREYFLL